MRDEVGVQAPAIMLLAFVPMLFIAAAYYYLNRADPDCGTTFSWVSRAMGTQLGWLGGRGIFIADLLVMPSPATIAASYSFLLVGADGLAARTALSMGAHGAAPSSLAKVSPRHLTPSSSGGASKWPPRVTGGGPGHRRRGPGRPHRDLIPRRSRRQDGCASHAICRRERAGGLEDWPPWSWRHRSGPASSS